MSWKYAICAIRSTFSSILHLYLLLAIVKIICEVEVDFGDIGELLKVRLEVDGTGEQPEFYLEYVEMRDLDTDERLVVRLRNQKNIQP